VLLLSVFTFCGINKLRVISQAQNPDSARLHHLTRWKRYYECYRIPLGQSARFIKRNTI